ncbi:hypothetical protein GCM10023177_73160 [Streptomyces violaceoruber]
MKAATAVSSPWSPQVDAIFVGRPVKRLDFRRPPARPALSFRQGRACGRERHMKTIVRWVSATPVTSLGPYSDSVGS